MRYGRVLLVVGALMVGAGCQPPPAVQQMLGESPVSPLPSAPTRDERVAGVDGGRFMYPADSTDYCIGPRSSVGIPCRDVLLTCYTDPVTGERTAVAMPATYRCGPNSPSTDEACILQPQYAEFYGCKPAD